MANGMTEQIQGILQSVVEEKLVVTVSDNLFKLGILDSVLLIQLVTRIEERYGISVADREMNPDNFLSIERIDAYLTQKMGSRK